MFWEFMQPEHFAMPERHRISKATEINASEAINFNSHSSTGEQ